MENGLRSPDRGIAGHAAGHYTTAGIPPQKENGT
jgi:hypothetical protein